MISIKKAMFVVFAILVLAGTGYANTTTSNYELNKPAVNDPQDQDVWGDLLNENFDIIDTELKSVADSVAGVGSVPIGAVMAWPGASAPTGWLLSYGQSIGEPSSGADVEDEDLEILFDIVKVAYGNTGSENFDNGDTVDLPDCRGRVLAGQDDMGGTSANRLTGTSGSVNGDTLGGTGGAETHTLSVGEMPSHSHSITVYRQASGSSTLASARDSASGGVSDSTASAGSGQAHNNVQPTLIMNCIIFAGI